MLFRSHHNRQTELALRDPLDADFGDMAAGENAVRSPMHGKLVALLVAPGDLVTKGQRLAIVEAMKMEHALVAPRDGVVSEVHGAAGGQVAQGAVVVAMAVEPVN